jgi:hypothetical protein
MLGCLMQLPDVGQRPWTNRRPRHMLSAVDLMPDRDLRDKRE